MASGCWHFLHFLLFLTSLRAPGATEGCEKEDLLGEPSDEVNLLHVNRVPRSKDLGVVNRIYTFGAPATSTPAMPNKQAANGCFQGLRTYTENVIAGGTHEVDAASVFTQYPHAKVAALALHWDENSFFAECADPDVQEAFDWPKGGASHWEMHGEQHYRPRLGNVSVEGRDVLKEEPFATANKMMTLAYKSYDTVSNVKAAIKEHLPGWRLVDRQVYENTDTYYDTDPIMLAQEESTLNCALVFTGTDNFWELFTSTSQSPSDWCGFDQVHLGYRDEVRTILKHDSWNAIKAKLAKCNEVYCVGHSLGGAMCDVFSGCVNTQDVSNADFQSLMWHKEAPEFMPEVGDVDTEQLGTISAIFTYGAPGSADLPLENKLTDDGCFYGLRTYTEDDLAGGGKRVDARAFTQNTMPHLWMPSIGLHWHEDSYFAECKSEGVTWPQHSGASYDDWNLHTEANYGDRLAKHVSKSPQKALYEQSLAFVDMAFAYNQAAGDVKLLMNSSMPGWRIVAYTVLEDAAEPLLLAQDERTLSCAVTLPGEQGDRASNWGTGFCGLENVHAGYRNQLSKIMEAKAWSSVKAKLAQCKDVICVGRSKGGAMCDIFSACVNSQATDDQDFLRAHWMKGTVQLMPENI
mmetsp:Transcript_63946/g.113705  ORF Transcript_63946/g.113705 Transcript_63946/m.113705 type:complete len:633 (-) Transcript_63946:72-1970(-)